MTVIVIVRLVLLQVCLLDEVFVICYIYIRDPVLGIIGIAVVEFVILTRIVMCFGANSVFSESSLYENPIINFRDIFIFPIEFSYCL